MEPPIRRPAHGTAEAALAGLQAGLVAVSVLLLWTGISSVLEFRSVWSAEILMASVFYGPAAIRGEVPSAALAGLALYLLLYSLAGALFAILIHGRLPRFRLTLVAIFFGLAWYYAVFRFAAYHWAPLVNRLHPAGPTLWGHVIYGGLLARCRLYLSGPRETAPEAAGAAETPAGESTADPGQSPPGDS